jgi:hypothetical protein
VYRAGQAAGAREGQGLEGVRACVPLITC